MGIAELRTAVTLSRYWQKSGREAEAHRLVASLYGRYQEGLDTLDLVAARSVLGGVTPADPSKS